MTDAKLEVYLQRLREEFPDYVVACFPYRSPDDEAIEHFLHVLDVPEDELTPVTYRAFDLALELYGEINFPFHLTTVSPSISAEYFPEQLAAAGRGWVPVAVQRPIGALRTQSFVPEATRAASTWQPSEDDADAFSEHHRHVIADPSWARFPAGTRTVRPGVALQSAGSVPAKDLLQSGCGLAA